MIPPIEPPVVAIPVAAARRFMNQWAIAPTAGVNMRDEPMPETREKEMKKCHNSAIKLVSDL